jgi:hypothetical protein
MNDRWRVYKRAANRMFDGHISLSEGEAKSRVMGPISYLPVIISRSLLHFLPGLDFHGVFCIAIACCIWECGILETSIDTSQVYIAKSQAHATDSIA